MGEQTRQKEKQEEEEGTVMDHQLWLKIFQNVLGLWSDASPDLVHHHHHLLHPHHLLLRGLGLLYLLGHLVPANVSGVPSPVSDVCWNGEKDMSVRFTITCFIHLHAQVFGGVFLVFSESRLVN